MQHRWCEIVGMQPCRAQAGKTAERRRTCVVVASQVDVRNPATSKTAAPRLVSLMGCATFATPISLG